MQSAIFVTGAASGIGQATARLFAARGWAVGAFDIDAEGAKKIADELTSSGGTTCAGRLDVTQEASWRDALAVFEQSLGRMDVLFNSAGLLRMGRFEDVSVEDCRAQLDVNVMGIVLGVRACLPMLERCKGAIVNMSSASAVYGQPELAVYSASKFAVRALTEALDLELGPRGIRVSDVMPGYVDTPMVREQSHRARTLDRLGVKLVATDVAEVVWKAAHGGRVHWFPQRDMAVMSRFGGLVPELSRIAMRRFSRPD